MLFPISFDATPDVQMSEQSEPKYSNMEKHDSIDAVTAVAMQFGVSINILYIIVVYTRYNLYVIFEMDLLRYMKTIASF